MLLEYGHEVAPLAIFRYNIAVVTGNKDIEALDDVGMFDLLEDSHLGFEHLPVGGGVLAQVDDLYCEWLGGAIFGGLEHPARIPFSNHVA